MFPMTVTVANQQQLTAVMAAMGFTADLSKPAPKADAPKAAPVAEKPAATPPTAPAAAVPEQKAENSEPAAASGKTIEDAKALTMKLVADKGRDAAVALLKEYGVPVTAKLPTEKIAAFCADAEKALAS